MISTLFSRKRQQPKVSLHTDLKGMFVICLLVISAASAGVTTAMQPVQHPDPATPPDTGSVGQAWNNHTFTHAGLRLNMSEQDVLERFPNARTMDAQGGIRLVTFRTEDGTWYVVWINHGGTAHRIKAMRQYRSDSAREILADLSVAFGRADAGDCTDVSNPRPGCSFTWQSSHGWQVEATSRPTDQDSGRVHMSLTFTDTGQAGRFELAGPGS